MRELGTKDAGRNRGWLLALGCLCLLLGISTFALRTHGSAATPDSESPAGDRGATRAQALERLGVQAWHAAGQRGQGLKVAVLDSGFCGYRAHLGKALPERVTVQSFRRDGNLEARDSQHGILCGETVHALAPEAELLFANWEPERPEQFLAAVRWAGGQGARVVSCSVIMPTWSDGEGHGPVHEALARILGPGDRPGDLLCFASAGNTAQRHWGGPFRGAGRAGLSPQGWHEWAPGQAANPLRPWGGERVSVELYRPAGATDFELRVEDVTAGREVGRARTSAAADRPGTAVAFVPEAGHRYALRVRQTEGEPGPFHVVVLGGGLRYATARGSIPFPGDGPEVIAVGAVDQQGLRLAYSSCGPDSGRPKPDLVAPVPFPSGWRSRPFTGTSAATPQAAALAALLWSRHPDWTARQVRQALQDAALHTGPWRHDRETGFGEVHLP
jgi:hypothetical protein